MSKKIILYLFMFLELFMITGCHKNNIDNKIDNDISNNLLDNDKDNDIEIDEINIYGGKNGTADSMIGKTLIVSIYTDDKESSWNPNKEIDEDLMNDTLNNLKIATNWLEEQANNYHKEAKFIYDWETNPDIKYNAKFNDISFEENNYGEYYEQRNWIGDNIDILKLKKKYRYDNIIFVFFFNIQSDSEFLRSNSYNSPWNFDIINLFVQDGIYYTAPTTYAHEIIHLFGAPDLYYESDKITKDYVDYIWENEYDDIMNSTNSTREITNTFSDLDAYYVGLIDECVDVEKWNLGISEHIE